MRPNPTAPAVAALCVLATGLAVHLPASGVDTKWISTTDCIPYGPDTTAAELTITPTGIYNPGIAIEKVICPLPVDQEYVHTVGELRATVRYRVIGGAPGRVTCTMIQGSTTSHPEAVLTSTVSSDLLSAGARGQFNIDGQAQYNSNMVVLACAISPKTSISEIAFLETDDTDQHPL